MKKTLGRMIAELRKQKGMTQWELAEKMGVTDKAVSKWERDLSYPDINSLPNLSAILGVSLEELMQIQREGATRASSSGDLLKMILKAIAIAMGIAVTVLAVLNRLDTTSGMVMLGIGLTCVGVFLLKDK